MNLVCNIVKYILINNNVELIVLSSKASYAGAVPARHDAKQSGPCQRT